jgi:hypothetical protein
LFCLEEHHRRIKLLFLNGALSEAVNMLHILGLSVEVTLPLVGDCSQILYSQLQAVAGRSDWSNPSIGWGVLNIFRRRRAGATYTTLISMDIPLGEMTIDRIVQQPTPAGPYNPADINQVMIFVRE